MKEIYNAGTLAVWAKYEDDGRLAINGQDLGGHAVYEEYEYFIRVQPEDFPALVASLGGQPGDDVLELVTAKAQEVVQIGESTWLTAHGIPYKFDNYGHGYLNYP